MSEKGCIKHILMIEITVEYIARTRECIQAENALDFIVAISYKSPQMLGGVIVAPTFIPDLEGLLRAK